MKHRRRSLVLGSTIVGVLAAIVGVQLYDLAVGGVNRVLVTLLAVGLALVIFPLLGLFVSGASEDGEIDEAAQTRAPSRR